MAKDTGTGLRKRSQITKANRTMFIWVASMAAVTMICLVVSYHLVHIITFNARVIGERAKTIGNLQTSNKNINELKSQVRALDADENLQLLKANPEDQAVQVVLDALPAASNPLSFGASLQTVLLIGPEGVDIKSISVDAAEPGAADLSTQDNVSTNKEDGNATDSQDTSQASTGSESLSANTGVVPIGFDFVVEGPETSLQEILQRLEKSIRTVDVTSIAVQRQGGKNEMSVRGNVFYQPQKTADLRQKVVK